MALQIPTFSPQVRHLTCVLHYSMIAAIWNTLRHATNQFYVKRAAHYLLIGFVTRLQIGASEKDERRDKKLLNHTYCWPLSDDNWHTRRIY